MLQTIAKYKRSLLGIVAVGFVAMAMGGFGVDLIGRDRSEQYAIKVNDRSVSFSEFSDERRNLEQRYRQILGKNFDEAAKSLKLNLNQQTIDRIIADTLFQQEAAALGFYVGDDAVASMLQTELFPAGFNAEQYRAFLNQLGMTSQAFEEKLRGSALRGQLEALLTVVSKASKREARGTVELEDTKYNVVFAEFAPESYLKDARSPTDSEIEAYYNENASGYELPPRVSYDYIVLEPKQFVGLVEVSPDDIELYYSDNQERFSNPEEIRARQIRVSIPEKAENAKKDELRLKAQEALEKARTEGQPFDELAKRYSDDTATAIKGGDLGWIAKGRLPKKLEEAAFKLEDGAVTDVIEASNAFYIVKVEERKEAAPKPLGEVRDLIEKEIRQREAPSYTASKARDLFDAFKKSGSSLADFAKANNLAAVSGPLLAEKSSDPPGLPGLTAEILEGSLDKEQLIDLGEKSVLAAVREYKEPEIASLALVREKVIDALKRTEARKLAADKAGALLEALQNGKFSLLKDAAKSMNAAIQEKTDLTRKSQDGLFAEGEIRAAVFSASQALEKPAKVVEVQDKFYVLQVTSIVKPSAEEIEKRASQREEQENQQLAELLITSTLNRLKAKAKIDIDPSLLAQE